VNSAPLIGAAGLAALVGSFKDALVILAVVVINALVGFYQEYRAERSLEALKSMLPLEARVRRDGNSQIINADAVVPGDLLCSTVQTAALAMTHCAALVRAPWAMRDSIALLRIDLANPVNHFAATRWYTHPCDAKKPSPTRRLSRWPRWRAYPQQDRQRRCRGIRDAGATGVRIDVATLDAGHSAARARRARRMVCRRWVC
jgi:hypothetical protein